VENKEVTLFIPCLVDQVYPEIGVAIHNVLSHLGYEVKYAPKQTCCGQPAFNSGHRDEAKTVARAFINSFRDVQTIVTVSGSCAAMVRVYYRELFEEDADLDKAVALGARLFEFSEFLVKNDLYQQISGAFPGRIGFHNSCHTFRELGLKEEPLQVLRQITGYDFIESANEQVCCGFGGVFYVKFPAVSSQMGASRLEYFMERGADTIVANDPGCIMQLRQEAAARDYPVAIYHLAEFLAQAMDLEGTFAKKQLVSGAK
jgi:L-lactate dehydrogenase complex protein LldE